MHPITIINTLQRLPFGCKARDVITGIEGTVTAASCFITGCDQLSLTLVREGKVVHEWFDATRLERVGDTQVQLVSGKSTETQKPGGPAFTLPGKA